MKQYETIDGYPLEVGPAWNSYTPEQRAEMMNGVGRTDQPEWLESLLNALPYLAPASRPHDIDYHAGGTERDRRAADRRFRRNGYRVARVRIGGFFSRLFRRPKRAQWAFAVFVIENAYLTLRVAGAGAFNYQTESKA